ncbi:hypothetical protein [Sphingosinicella sp. BN140058]|nr:hypothetical protein [Sphingosinicella sp. BN140058]
MAGVALATLTLLVAQLGLAAPRACCGDSAIAAASAPLSFRQPPPAQK